jgi:hypothetical protein
VTKVRAEDDAAYFDARGLKLSVVWISSSNMSRFSS